MPSEDLLRETFAAYAERAPRGTALAGVARQRARARRRSAYAVAAAGLATVGVVVAAFAVVSPPRPRPGVPLALTGPTRVESWGSLEVSVPAGLEANALGCGNRADRDTVVVGEHSFAVMFCDKPEPPGLTVGYLQSAAAWDARAKEYWAVGSEPATVDGHPAEQVRARTPDGRHVAGVVVRGVNGAFWVASADRELAESMVATLRVVDVNHLGCATKLDALYPAAAPERAGARTAMVPGRPAEVSACQYGEDGRLAQSVRVAGEPLTRLTGELNTLDPGMHAAPPDARAACGSSGPAPGVFRFRYDSGPGVDVYVHVAGCERVGVTNGAVEGRLRASLTELMHERFVMPSAYWGGWVEEPGDL